MFDNYRTEISNKVAELESIYNKIDRYFHIFFVLKNAEYAVTSTSFYECSKIAKQTMMNWFEEFENVLSRALYYLRIHKGSFFDSSEDLKVDKYNCARIEILKSNISKYYKLVKESRIVL